MTDILDLERRVALLEQRFASAENVRQQGNAEIKADIAQLAAHIASFEQRFGRRLIALETRIAGLEARIVGLETRMDGLEAQIGGLDTRMANVETAVGSVAQDVREILRRLPG